MTFTSDNGYKLITWNNDKYDNMEVLLSTAPLSTTMAISLIRILPPCPLSSLWLSGHPLFECCVLVLLSHRPPLLLFLVLILVLIPPCCPSSVTLSSFSSLSCLLCSSSLIVAVVLILIVMSSLIVLPRRCPHPPSLSVVLFWLLCPCRCPLSFSLIIVLILHHRHYCPAILFPYPSSCVLVFFGLPLSSSLLSQVLIHPWHCPSSMHSLLSSLKSHPHLSGKHPVWLLKKKERGEKKYKNLLCQQSRYKSNSSLK